MFRWCFNGHPWLLVISLDAKVLHRVFADNLNCVWCEWMGDRSFGSNTGHCLQCLRGFGWLCVWCSLLLHIAVLYECGWEGWQSSDNKESNIVLADIFRKTVLWKVFVNHLKKQPTGQLVYLMIDMTNEVKRSSSTRQLSFIQIKWFLHGSTQIFHECFVWWMEWSTGNKTMSGSWQNHCVWQFYQPTQRKIVWFICASNVWWDCDHVRVVAWITAFLEGNLKIVRRLWVLGLEWMRSNFGFLSSLTCE